MFLWELGVVVQYVLGYIGVRVESSELKSLS